MDLDKQYDMVDTVYLSNEKMADKMYQYFVNEGYCVMKSSQMLEIGHKIRLDIMTEKKERDCLVDSCVYNSSKYGCSALQLNRKTPIKEASECSLVGTMLG